MCLLARTSSIKSAFLFLCFPGFREEPFFLQVTVLEEGRTTEPLILSLGHNRVTAVRWSTGNYGNPPERGPYQVRHIRAESAYMRYFPVPGLNVLVNGVSSTEAITDRNGQYSDRKSVV